MSRLTLRGRSEEMDTLLGALRQTTRTGQSGVVALTGKPGMGKSSVLLDAAEQARRRGFAVGVGKAEEIDQIAAGAPLLVALRSGPKPLLDAAGFASLAPLYERQLWLVDRVAELLEEAASSRPVLIGLDDVQWADPLTRFALRILPSRLAGSPVVWLLTSRLAPADRIEEILAACDPLLTITRIPVGPLRSADIDALAADRLGERPDPVTLQLLNGVGGSPFWAVQLLTGLARRRARGLPEAGPHAELIAGIRQRMAALPEFVASVIKVVAVRGRPVEASVVAELLGDTTPELVSEAAADGQDEGLLGVEEAGLTLPHDLIRQAVYAHIPPVERRRLHRVSGRQLAATGAGPLAAAPHFRASAEPVDPEAAEMILRAAAASVHLMPAQAAVFAREAFALLDAADPGAFPAGERVLAVLAGSQRYTEVLSLAGSLLPIATTPEMVARIEVAACRALWDKGATLDLERRVDVAVARPGMPEIPRARLMALRALASTRTPAAPMAALAATAARAEGERLNDIPTRRTALHALAEAARNVGTLHLALDHLDELESISPGTHTGERIRVLQHLDRYAEAAGLLAAARHDAGQDLHRLLPSYLFVQAWQQHNLAEFEAAEATARELLRQADAMENFPLAMNARIILTGIAIYRGELARAHELLALIESWAETADELWATRLRLTQAWLAAAEGDPHRTLEIVGPMLRAADNGSHSWAWAAAWMRTFGGIAHQVGDERLARQALHIAELGARRNPGVASLEGVALQLRGHLEADAGLLRRAVAVLRRSPRPLLLANALYDLGTVLTTDTTADGAADGLDALREAYDIFDRLGAWGYARQVDDRLTALGGAPRKRRPAVAPRPRSGWPALTESEARVAELIGAGYTNRAAAAELGVSSNTVGTHLRAVFTKLDVRSRVQLANALRSRP